MGLMEKIEHDVAEAMKARDEIRMSTLRLLRAAVKNAEIEDRVRGEVDIERIVLAVLKRQLKQTEEAAEEFKKGGRADLFEKAAAEIAILKSYLPEQMSDEEIAAIISRIVKENSGSNAGKIIGLAMKEIAGRANGARVRFAVEAMLKET